MKRIAAVVPYAALLLSLGGVPAFAQLSTAQLDGRVTDESGAVLPGATVTVVQTDTSFTRTVVTDGDGGYVLPNLPTGPYRLEISLSGFRTYTQTGIVLQVATTPTINVALAVGGLEESVTVEAASPLVDVRSAGLNEVVANERIVELPLQGREVTSLLVLAGGSVQTTPNANRTVNGGARIAVDGGLSFGVTYLLDGAMHSNPQDNLNLPLPFPDALQEFSVATSGLTAQNGVHSGAAVTAVTKSGTNRFAGNAFEFVRDKQFNATNPFAAVGPDGKRLDDGLSRHQFGGTFGGPIVKDRLFFFGAYQGTRTRSVPAANIAWVPTPAMLAGDFTTFASPACNNGRQVSLRAPFVNNQLAQNLISPAALKLSKLLPQTSDPCGQVTYGIPTDSNQWQGVGKVDYQLTSNHTLFGRYLHTSVDELPVWDPTAPNANILTTSKQGQDRTALAKSLALGDTLVFGNNVVNAFRVADNRTAISAVRKTYVDGPTLGINNFYTAFPGKILVGVTSGFNIGHACCIFADLRNRMSLASDDLTFVRGRHQFAVGGTYAYSKSYQELNLGASGQFNFNGSITGLGLADFLAGRVFQLQQSNRQILAFDETYIGTYAQDTWRMSARVTLNAGLRWEPFFGQNITRGAVSSFSEDRFLAGTRSRVFVNAPAGLLFPGDAGFPSGRSGINHQWGNASPRVGVAWDARGNGRTAVRSSYALTYDVPPGDYWYVNAGAAPYASRLVLPGISFDNPYQNYPGGNPFPFPSPPRSDAAFPAFGNYGSIDPDVNSPRVQTWNVTLEQQLGPAWGVTASYLGSHSDRLWGAVARNPGVFMGLGPCTLKNGVSYPICTTNANLDVRRALYQKNPVEGQLLGSIDHTEAVGIQNYRALRVAVRRRAASGVSVSGNYTLSHCVGNVTPVSSNQFSSGFLKPDDPSFDEGNCEQSRTHIANVTVGAQTPKFANTSLAAIASGWRISGIVNARSGDWLSITTSQDIAGIGITGQRVNQLSDHVYGDNTLARYLDRAAFAFPDPGTLGNSRANSLKGPGFWSVDMGVSRLLSVAQNHTLEFRVEAFNLLNNFNWGNPTTNFDSGQFGRINAMAGDPRIMQFAVKYEF
jgi:hypothetical protein